MKKLLLFLFGLFYLVSCMDEDISKISNTIEIQPNIAIPIIHSTTTLIDLLPEDESISYEDDGYIRIFYREDDVTEVSSDSLFVIEDQEPTEESFYLDSIDIDDFQVAIDVTLSDLITNLNGTLASDINQAISYAESSNEGKAYFPPIPSQSAGIYSEQGSDAFESILISEGDLSIEITNNFPIEISFLQIELRNNLNQHLLGTFQFNEIEVGATEVSSIVLDQVLMYNQIDLSIVELSSVGSGNNPLNQDSWVSISSTDELEFMMVGTSINAIEGMIKFPEQEGPSDTFNIEMQFDDEVEITRIDLSSGYFIYTYESTVNTVLNLTIEIPSLENQFGAVFSETIQIENTEFTGPQSVSVSLDNYSFYLSEAENQLEVNYFSEIMGSSNYVSYSEDDEINILIGLEDLDFNYIEGYFGQIEEVIQEDELDLDFSAIEDITSGIYLETPNLRFTVDNSVNVPFELDFNLTGYNENESVSLDGPKIDVLPLASSSTDLNNSNSQLSNLIALNPSQIIYSGSVLSNPDGNVGDINSISSDANISIGYEMDLPLYLRIEDAERTDTLELDFGEENDNNSRSDYVDSVSLKLHTENEFPLDVDLMILFTDSVTGSVLDSIDIALLDAAEVDDDGRTITANIYDSNIALNSGQIDALYNANRVLLDVKMNSYDNQNTAVRLYTHYEFVIALGILLDINIEE